MVWRTSTLAPRTGPTQTWTGTSRTSPARRIPSAKTWSWGLLQSFHVGFVEQALRARVPIVPVAFLGADDQAPILYDIKPLARWLGLPVAPITPTFPWLGPLGLLPYPVRYRIIYGEPLRFHERFGPEGADDARLVEYLAKQVRRTIQLMIDKNR